MRTLRAQERRFGLASVSPTILVVLLVVLVPVVWTAVLSLRTLRLFQLQRVNLFGGALTLANYRDVLTDPYFWQGWSPRSVSPAGSADAACCAGSSWCRT